MSGDTGDTRTRVLQCWQAGKLTGRPGVLLVTGLDLRWHRSPPSSSWVRSLGDLITVIPGLCRTPERGGRPSQIPTTHLPRIGVEKGQGCGSPRFCLNPPVHLSLGAGFPTSLLFLFTAQDFLPPPGPNPSSTLRREKVKWYSHCSPNQSPSTPGGQRAASGRGTWVVCGSRVRQEMEMGH